MVDDRSEIVGGRVLDRLRRLALSVLYVSRDGSAEMAHAASPLDQCVAQSPGFARLMREHWSTLCEGPAEAVAPCAGVYLAPLSGSRQRNAGDRRRDQKLRVVMVLTQAILDTDLYHDSVAAEDAALFPGGPEDAREHETLATEREAARLLATVEWLQHDAAELHHRNVELRANQDQLMNTYEELSLLYRLSMNMTVAQQPTRLLADGCERLRAISGYRWVAVVLSHDRSFMGGLADRVVVAGESHPETATIKTIASIAGTRPTIEDGARVLDVEAKTPLSRACAEMKQAMVIDLARKGRQYGMLIAGDRIGGSKITCLDIKLGQTLAATLAGHIDNVLLYERSREMFLGTLHALTTAIDAKDSYTHGHSQRVAVLARRLALEAGLDEEAAERVYLSALVHDVGKIGVPEAVLTKAAPLTDAERVLVHRHPEIGARILQDIHAMRDLLPGVLHHHERWDGQGYPRRLAGEAIPLFARIIAIADAYDAMSSHRTYGMGWAHADILDEIERCAGSQFDPQLAARFVAMEFEPLQALMADLNPQSLKRSA